MSAPDPYAGTEEEFTIADWKEVVANFRPGSGNSFSRRSGEASLTGLIPSVKLRGALRFFLGYDNVSGTPKYINRTNPVYHPLYTNLICTNAGEEEFSPGDYRAGVGRVLKVAAKSALSYSGSPIFVAPRCTHRTAYKKARVTLRFQPVEWGFAEDGGSGGGGEFDRDHEYQRNTYPEFEPRTEVLSLDGYQLIFAEGENCPGLLTSPKGAAVPAPFGQLLVKPDLVFHWRNVPENFLMQNGLPTKILEAVGKVNATAWRGYPAGTLLLVGAKLIRTPWGLAAGTESLFNYDVALLMSYFNPTKGKTGNPAVPITDNLGHNNLPWQGLAQGAAIRDGAIAAGLLGAITKAGDTNAGKWFLATRTGGNAALTLDGSGKDITSDLRLIEAAEFKRIFWAADRP